MIWEKISSFGGTSQIKAWRTDLGQVKTESLNSKEIKPVNPKGNQPWIFIGRTDAEAEAPVLWPSEAMSQFTVGNKNNNNKNLGKTEGKRRRGWQKMKWFDSITDSVDMKVKVKVTQQCPTVCNTMSYTVHGILYPFSSGSSWPRNQTRVSCIAGGFFTNWAIQEAPVDTNLSKLQETVDDRGAWRAAVHRVTESRTLLSTWKATTVAKNRVQETV